MAETSWPQWHIISFNGRPENERVEPDVIMIEYEFWVLNVSAKCLHFRFEFAEGQNTKIQSKFQNSFQAQNAKISAVSTPILTGKAAFLSIFRALSEK